MLENILAGNLAESNDPVGSGFQPDDPLSYGDVDKIVRQLEEIEKELFDGCKKFTRL